MKTARSIALLTGLAFMSVHVFAQANMTSEQLAKQQTELVKRNINKVTPEEENKVLMVEQEFARNLEHARTKSGSDTAAISKRTLYLCDIRDSKIKKILTDLQYSQYLDMEKGWGCKLNCTKQ